MGQPHLRKYHHQRGRFLVGSLFACVVVTVVTGLAYGYWLIALIPGVITGILCFVLLQVCMHVAEKRRKELDNPKDEE